mgnify:CR=1 FL=1
MEYYKKSDLKSLGWSKTMIDQLLPTHDGESENPIFSHWARTKYYLANRVDAIMATQAWQNRRNLAAKRSAIQSQSYKKRFEAKVTSKVYKDPYGRFTINHGLSYNELLSLACRHQPFGVAQRYEIMKQRHFEENDEHGTLILYYILDEHVDIDVRNAPVETKVDVYKSLFKIYPQKNIKVQCLAKLVDHIHLN